VVPVSWQVAQTGVAWGDTHFALIGAGVLGGFAGLHYWFPKIRGRYMGTTLAGASFWAIFVGTIVMVVPIQLAGLEGMPVDVNEFFADTDMSLYNLLGSLGTFLLAIGIVLTLVNAAASYNRGARAPHDPWGGATLEWFALSPPPPHNFDLVPDVRNEEPYREIREAVRRQSTELTLPAASPPDREPEPVPVAPGEAEADEPEDGRRAAAAPRPAGHGEEDPKSSPGPDEVAGREDSSEGSGSEADRSGGSDDRDDGPLA
jgi:heme/copper-type cytochrome/quinol oxidase subunit 1